MECNRRDGEERVQKRPNRMKWRKIISSLLVADIPSGRNRLKWASKQRPKTETQALSRTDRKKSLIYRTEIRCTVQPRNEQTDCQGGVEGFPVT